MKILFFADIVGQIGREAVKMTLPDFCAEHVPDLVIANCENLAHGKGVTAKTIDDMHEAGVDLFTSGNHIFDRQDIATILGDSKYSELIIRPANYPPGTPGRGYKVFKVGQITVLVINFLGQVFSEVKTENPFRLFDEILIETASQQPDVVLVDFHGEATSEKVAFGWHADGRASAVWGTHTHVPTRDERILPQGTAYISDVGMCGFRDGVIGVDRNPIISSFTTQLSVRHEVPATGEAVVNAIFVEINSDGHAIAIEHLSKDITI